MFAGRATVLPSESVNETVALAAEPDEADALDAEADADADALEADALPDALALAALLDPDEPPQATSPNTAAQHSATHARARALADFDSVFPCFMNPSLSLIYATKQIILFRGYS